jgi:hypothetical protein
LAEFLAGLLPKVEAFAHGPTLAFPEGSINPSKEWFLHQMRGGMSHHIPHEFFTPLC